MTEKKLPGKYYLQAGLNLAVPAAKVWEVLADFSVVDTWAPQVTRSYALDGQDRGLGAGRHCDIKGFGGVDERITKWVEGRSFIYSVTPLGPLGVSHSRWTVHEIDDRSSRVVAEFGYDVRFGLFGKLLHATMMRPKLESSFPKTLLALKRRVETGQLVRPRRSNPDQPQLSPAGA
ncbi:MAG: SRPBCC family protein [Sphingomonadales bacterium]